MPLWRHTLATVSRSLINQTIQSIPLPCECRTTTQPGSSPPPSPTPTTMSKRAYCLFDSLEAARAALVDTTADGREPGLSGHGVHGLQCRSNGQSNSLEAARAALVNAAADGREPAVGGARVHGLNERAPNDHSHASHAIDRTCDHICHSSPSLGHTCIALQASLLRQEHLDVCCKNMKMAQTESEY